MVSISVIIPSFNSGKKLERLINSIPEGNIEVIVVDDNSTEKMLLPFDREVVVIHNNTGIRGAGVCRNLGLEKAKGEYVVFADSDDYFLPGAFDIIEKYKKGKDIIYFSPVSIIEGSNQPSKRHLYYENLIKDQDLDMIRTRFHVPWSKLYRRCFIEHNQIRFDEVIASNDVIFSAKTGILSKNIDVSKDSIYCVTCSSDSLTKNKSKEVRKVRLEIAIRFNKLLKVSGFQHCRYSLLEIIYEYRDVIRIKDVYSLIKMLS